MNDIQPHQSAEDFARDADRPGQLYIVWLVVLGLALINVGLSTLEFGRYALLFQLVIATVQAILVCYHFMHLKQGDKVVILTALASVFWVGILFVLLMADYMTRHLVVG